LTKLKFKLFVAKISQNPQNYGQMLVFVQCLFEQWHGLSASLHEEHSGDSPQVLVFGAEGMNKSTACRS
jgi:hypothetical protein